MLVNQALNRFAKHVVTQSKSNLTKGGKNVNKTLYNSIVSELEVGKNSFRLSFDMEEYGQYQDLGVKGKASGLKAPNSPFKFGSGTGKKGGLTDGILKWVTRKRFQFKDRQSGKFLSYNQTAKLITRSIYLTGIKPSLFFTKPFESAFKNLPDELIEAFALDLESLMTHTKK
jgi:hypothetical protein